MKNFIKNILISLWSPFKPNKNQFFLFIMGLPRSGSSLLMHILESNNDKEPAVPKNEFSSI